MSESIAAYDGKNVRIISNDVEYTIPKKDYDRVKEIFTFGINEEDLSPVITPSDIIGYLAEVNPEAEHNAMEAATIIAKRQLKDDLQIKLVWGVIIIGIIMAGALGYTMITGGSDGGSTVANAANVVTVG
jgi:hypothetical protein